MKAPTCWEPPLPIRSGIYQNGITREEKNQENSRVFCPAYRLAPEHPFPAALEDAVEAYRYLLNKGYGPEHITLTVTGEEAYYYYIHHFAGSGSIASSGAQITVEQGDALIAVYNVPANLGDDIYWNVFAIKNGQLIPNNTITSSPDTSYAE